MESLLFILLDRSLVYFSVMFHRRVAILFAASSSSSAPEGSRVTPPCPYEVLGVHKSTPFNEVKTRFHDLTRYYHPDMPHGNPEKFREINAAYRLLRAAQRNRRSEDMNTSESMKNFWSGDGGTAKKEYNGARAQDWGGRDRHASPKWQKGFVREMLWFYEGYELAIVLGAAVAVLIIAVERYLLVQRMTREKRARLRAMEEGLPPSMPLVVDDMMLSKYSERVPQEEIDIDNAVVKEEAYYRRATQRRFEDFREFLFVFDPDGVTSRRVTTTRFSIQYLDEDLIPKRCVHVMEFDSETKDMQYEKVVKDVTEKLSTTNWAASDAQHIVPLLAKGLGVIPMNSPDTAKWTFIEYTNKDEGSATPSCLLALRNRRFDRLGMCQRVTVTGCSSLSPKLIKKREADLQSGVVTKKKLLWGGTLPVKDLSIPLEHMKL